MINISSKVHKFNRKSKYEHKLKEIKNNKQQEKSKYVPRLTLSGLPLPNMTWSPIKENVSLRVH